MINENFVLTTLDKNSEYYDDVIKLIETEFHYENTHQYEKDFAPLLTPNNFENCLIIIDKKNNELAAHLGFVKKIFIFNKHTVSAVFIGGIATKKKYQGKGLFKSLINSCIEKNKDISLFLLWSSIDGLYEKYGFTRAGAILETGKNVITTDNIPIGFQKTSFDKLSNHEFAEIKSLYRNEIENKLFSIKRSELDWDIIQQMTSVDLYIKKNSHNQISAYFCYGKGNDLKQIIHEFVAENFQQEVKEIDSFKLWLTENHLSNYPNQQLQYNAFIKIGNIAQLNKFLTPYKLEIISYEHPEVTLKFNGQNHNLNYADFLNGLFGPSPLEEFKAFKLYPYISGLDSV